ncbi:MAG: DUF6089 family protein [Bacteroidota bacterium]|nr:DUF6089 family protein [Bacteroidota bacterium]
MTKLFTVMLILFPSIVIFAQRGDVGLFAGGAYYTGDLNPGKPFQKYSPVAGAFYRYNFTDRLALRTGYSYATLISSDFQNRGLSFKTNLNEVSTQFEVNFSEFGIKVDEHNLSPYIFGGIGYTWFTAHKDSVGVKSSVQTNITSFPFGMGIKYNPLENVSMGLEWGLRKTLGSDADKIDNVYESGVRVSNAKDWYAFAGFWISIRLNLFNSERCEELRVR